MRPTVSYSLNKPKFGRETCPLEANFQSREKSKVTRRGRRLVDDRNVLLGEKLLHHKRCVVRCGIVMQKPLSLTLAVPLRPKCIAQPLQNFYVGITSNPLSRRYELMVHQKVDVTEFRELF
jgi:hypothetical protein